MEEDQWAPTHWPFWVVVSGEDATQPSTHQRVSRQLVHCTPPVGTDLSFSSQQRGLD